MALGERMRHDTPDGRGKDWAWASLKGFAHGLVRSSSPRCEKKPIDKAAPARRRSGFAFLRQHC